MTGTSPLRSILRRGFLLVLLAPLALLAIGQPATAGAQTNDRPDPIESRTFEGWTRDDQGRYVIPDLPAASYQVWVRGYGLVDSPRQSAAPGQSLDLNAVPAPSEAAAFMYWGGTARMTE